MVAPSFAGHFASRAGIGVPDGESVDVEVDHELEELEVDHELVEERVLLEVVTLVEV